MKIRVKLSRNQMQEILKDDDERKLLLRSSSFSHKLDNATDHTFGMDESGSMSHFDQSASSFANDLPTCASAPQAQARRARRSNSIRKIMIRQDSIKLVSSDEDVPSQRRRTDSKERKSSRDGSKERRIGRTGSFKIKVTRKHSSDNVFVHQDTEKPRQSRTALRRDDPVPKSRRSPSGGRASKEAAPAARGDSPKTPATSNNRRSLRAKSFNFVAPRLSLAAKREKELEISRQESVSRIKELDDMLARKSPSQPVKGKIRPPPKSPSAITSKGIVHSWDGALAHVTPGRSRKPLLDRSKCFEGTEKLASTLDILTAYDKIMKEFDDETCTIDTNTGW